MKTAALALCLALIVSAAAAGQKRRWWSVSRTHLAHGIGTMLDAEWIDPLAVPVTSAGPLEAEPLICVPPKPRLWWLCRGAATAGNVALAALIP